MIDGQQMHIVKTNKQLEKKQATTITAQTTS